MRIFHRASFASILDAEINLPANIQPGCFYYGHTLIQMLISDEVKC
jgi:hypothetical protein